MRKTVSTIAGAFVMLVGLAAPQAQAPQYWATYAYDSTTGRWGLGWGRTDRQTTINEALSRCQSPGCKAGNVVLARCITVATGTSPGPGFGTANDPDTAKKHALSFCRRGASGSTCEVDAVRCGN